MARRMTINLKSVLIAALVIAIPFSVHAAAPKWETHEYKEDGFSVAFSGPVTIKPTEVDEATQKTIVRSTMYMEEGKNYVFLVSASLFVSRPKLNAGAEAAMNAHGCETIRSDKDLRFKGGLAREIRGEKCAGGTYDAVGLFYSFNNWFYQVIYRIPTGSDAKDAEHFLRSLRFLKS